MSRIGKLPIAVPSGVDVAIEGAQVTVKGPKGTLSHTVAAPITGISMGLFYVSGVVFSVVGALILLCDLFKLGTAPMGVVDRFLDETGEQS